MKVRFVTDSCSRIRSSSASTCFGERYTYLPARAGNPQNAQEYGHDFEMRSETKLPSEENRP